jgi:hypothetical protein
MNAACRGRRTISQLLTPLDYYNKSSCGGAEALTLLLLPQITADMLGGRTSIRSR